MLEPRTISRLRPAFPSSLAAEVDAALALVSPCPIEPSDDDIGPVLVAGEALHIPSRIFSPEPRIDAQDSVTETAKMVLGCLYTRHSGGRIREKHLRTIISSSEQWVPPFVVQLIGEYVVEIHGVIEANVASLQQPSYVQFVAENPTFIELTTQRMISYWDCYFRRETPNLEDHVGFRLLKVLGAAR